VRSLLTQALQRRSGVESGHGRVEQHDIERFDRIAHLGDGGGAVGRFVDLEAQLGQQRARRLAHGELVIHHEDAALIRRLRSVDTGHGG
jgi:hypothetical protein